MRSLLHLRQQRRAAPYSAGRNVSGHAKTEYRPKGMRLETNVPGALWVTQAALPILREQGSGHILRVVDSDDPPLRLFLGESPLRIAVADYGSRLTTWAQWQQVAAAAQGT
jgi:hypothetical protein